MFQARLAEDNAGGVDLAIASHGGGICRSSPHVHAERLKVVDPAVLPGFPASPFQHRAPLPEFPVFSQLTLESRERTP